MKQVQFWCWIPSQHYDQSHILLVIIVFKKRNKTEYKKLPNVNTTKIHCLIQKHQVLQIYQLDLIYTTLQLKKQNKLALNPFDDKRLYINPIQSLPWDKHTQKGDCPCIYCLKLIGLYYKDLTINKTDEEIYWSVWYWKQALTHQQLVKLISDRAHVL